MPKPSQALIKLDRFLSYVLGRRPDEFGLVPDPDGYVKIKDFLKAMAEEEGWRYVRRSHLNEIILSLPAPGIEIEDNRIRAADRSRLPSRLVSENPPKLLFTGIRRKAYAHVQDKGISPSGQPQVLLSADKEMAERIGRRSDADPVILTVQVQAAEKQGVVFFRSGESLYLAAHIPPGSFTGPPLPDEKTKPAPKSEDRQRRFNPLAGTFFPDPAPSAPDGKAPVKGRRGKGNEQKKHKRGRHRERPPWRGGKV